MKKHGAFFILFLTSVLMVACVPQKDCEKDGTCPSPTPSPTATPSPTPNPTPDPTPTPSPTATPSPTPNPTPDPTPTPSPSATPTPNPTATPTPSPTADPVVGLELHPENPRYFLDQATGEPVLITSYTSIVPSSRNFDYKKDIADMKKRGITYSRVWHFLPWEKEAAIWPWARSGQPGAPMGGNKVDMNKWDSEYWTRLRDSLRLATEAGITAQIILFDRCGMSPASDTRWQGNPWARENNINNLEVPSASDDGTPEFYEVVTRPILRSYQEKYLRKMIDETIEFNVIYEIENEHWDHRDPEWAERNGRFIRDYIASKYPEASRLVSYNSLEDDLESIFRSSVVDIVNMHFGKKAERDPSLLNDYVEGHWGYRKPINIDEFANGLSDAGVLRNMTWTIVTSGGHFHIEDAAPEAAYPVVENFRRFKEESGWDFVHASPNRHFSDSGYCMVKGNAEVLCYYQSGGKKTVSLASGTYLVRWWNPRTGGYASSKNVQHGGADLNSKSPDGNDWVLHIKDVGGGVPTPTPTPVPTPNPTPDPQVRCEPTPPKLRRLNVKVHNHPNPNKWIIDSTPIVCSGDPGTPIARYCQEIMNDPNRLCCPVRPEGDPMRSLCEQEIIGKDPSDGLSAPHWTVTGGDLSVERHPDNPYLAIVRGTGPGTVTGCSNIVPFVCSSTNLVP